MKQLVAREFGHPGYPGGSLFRIGYCRCGEKVLIDKEEAAILANEFSWLYKREGMVKKVAVRLLKRLAED